MILTTYAKNNLLDLAFGGKAWAAKPATLHVGLLITGEGIAAPTDAGGGKEVYGGGYARISKTVGTSDFEQSTGPGNPVTNKTAVEFSRATAAWGTITHMALFDAATGGNMIAYKALPEPVVIAVNQTPSWAIGDFSFDTGGACGAWLGRSILNHLFCAVDFPTVATHYFSLGTGGTEMEVTGEPTIGTAAYARATGTNNLSTWGAAADGAKKLAALTRFPENITTAWGSVTNLGIHAVDGVGVSITGSSSSGYLCTTGSAHNLVTGDVVRMSAAVMPTGFSTGTDYYVIYVNATTFRLATSATLAAAGTAIAYTDAGTTVKVFPQKVIWQYALDDPLDVAVGDRPQFAANAIALSFT